MMNRSRLPSTFRLRDFLDTSEPAPTWAAQEEPPLRPRLSSLQLESAEDSHDEPPPLTTKPSADEQGGRVWVDCFFYGFYIDEKNIASFPQLARST